MMGKGVANEDSPLYLGCSIGPGDDPNCAMRAANVIVNVGHDTQEEPSFFMQPEDGRTDTHLNPFASEGESSYFPQIQADALGRLTVQVAPGPDRDHNGLRKTERAFRPTKANLKEAREEQKDTPDTLH